MFGAIEFRLVVVLIGMFTLPGWAVLTFNNSWRQWKGLQRWIVAVGISIAFYPVLFYATRSVIPFLTFGPYKMSALLLLCAIVTGWRMRCHWKEQFTFDRLEWVALGIFGMTLFTRFWIIRDHPYPAWSDSLHHTLITQLTAVQGRLPFDMEPYFPIPLGQYHLGLYSLSATVQWLAQVPAHTALLWTAQMLNGLCGIGVYLVLDRKMGRLGAIVGATVVGLWSHQPAWYVNWGRFTQIASQTILLIAWLVTWEAIVGWKRPWREHRTRILWSTAVAATLTGAVFLLHFRVAAFYVLLLTISILWELWNARRESQGKSVILGIIAIGTVALIVVAPVLWKPLYTHVTTQLAFTRMYQTGEVTSEISQTMEQFYEFPLRLVPLLAARHGLIVLTSLCGVIGLLKRNKLVIASILWVVMLCLVGNTYLLKLPLLNVSNMGAVLIMLYLPIGLIVGSTAEETLALCRSRWRGQVTRITTVFVLIVSFVASHIRVTEIELYRYFITPQDMAAMNWIRENTPSDALFAVNTYFWLPQLPHGTDAGYWIPYLTGRQTTVGTMLISLAATEYKDNLVQMSRAVERLEIDNASLSELQEMEVRYVYIGAKGDFSGAGLNAARLSQAEDINLLYQNARVSIFQIRSLVGDTQNVTRQSSIDHQH